jgi:hypothetical protein
MNRLFGTIAVLAVASLLGNNGLPVSWAASSTVPSTTTTTSTDTSITTNTNVTTGTQITVSTYTNTTADAQNQAYQNAKAGYQTAMANAQALYNQGFMLWLAGAMMLTDNTSSNDTEGWFLAITGQNYMSSAQNVMSTPAYCADPSGARIPGISDRLTCVCKDPYRSTALTSSSGNMAMNSNGICDCTMYPDHCTGDIWYNGLSDMIAQNNTNLSLVSSTKVSLSTSTALSTDYTTQLNTVDGGGNGNGNGDGGASTGIKIDPALLRSGEVSTHLADLAGKLGVGTDAMSQAIQDGSAAGMLGDHLGMSSDGVQKAMDNASANPMSADDMKAKLAGMGLPTSGIGSGDGGLLAGDSSGASSAGNYAIGGGGAGGGGRKLASDSNGSSSANSGMGAMNGKFGNGKDAKDGKLSKDILDAMARRGMTNDTIFQIVHRQYLKKAPMMFGTEAPKAAAPHENPFSKSPFEGLEKDQSPQL